MPAGESTVRTWRHSLVARTYPATISPGRSSPRGPFASVASAINTQAAGTASRPARPSNRKAISPTAHVTVAASSMSIAAARP